MCEGVYILTYNRRYTVCIVLNTVHNLSEKLEAANSSSVEGVTVRETSKQAMNAQELEILHHTQKLLSIIGKKNYEGYK